MRRPRFVLLALLACSSLTSTGCSQQGTLVAPTGERRFIARDAQSGVSVVLTAGAWQGEPVTLDRELTVVHVLVANMGQERVLLAPSDLELRDLKGFRYPLLDVGASFQRVQSVDGSAVYGKTYQPTYDLGAGGAVHAIEGSEDMAAKALPWGVLEPGTEMRGYLYFESLERNANGGRLVWHLQTPDHSPIVDLAFDLRVARAPRGAGR